MRGAGGGVWIAAACGVAGWLASPASARAQVDAGVDASAALSDAGTAVVRFSALAGSPAPTPVVVRGWNQVRVLTGAGPAARRSRWARARTAGSWSVTATVTMDLPPLCWDPRAGVGLAVSDGAHAAFAVIRARDRLPSARVVELRIERNADVVRATADGARIMVLRASEVPGLLPPLGDGVIAIGNFGDCALGPLFGADRTAPMRDVLDPIDVPMVQRDPAAAARRVQSTWTAVDVELSGIGAHAPVEWPSGVDAREVRDRFTGLPAPFAERARALPITNANARCVANAIIDSVVHRVAPDLARSDPGPAGRALRALARARRIVDAHAALVALGTVPGPDVRATYEVRRFPCAGLPCGLPWNIERVSSPPASCEPGRCEVRYYPASDTSAFVPMVRSLLELRSRWASDPELVGTTLSVAAELVANEGVQGAPVVARVFDEIERAAARPCTTR